MRNAAELIGRLRSRLSEDRLPERDFTLAVAEILAATTKDLSAADALMMSQEIRDLEQAWRASNERPIT